MKIAMVGCGAVGSYYGSMLSRAGRDVHFLLRSDYDAVRRNGVSIRSAAGDFVARPKCAQSPREIGPCDVVFIALKTTANSEFPKLLPPLVGPHTAIVTLQNGLGNEEELAKLFPVGQILGGLCFVGLNRTAPGVVQHLGEGRIQLGEFQRWPEPRTHDICSMLRHAGIPCKVTDDLACAHWEKLVWNIPFNGLGVASTIGYEVWSDPRGKLPGSFSRGPCLTSGELLDCGPWEKLVRELMLETIDAAKALGYPLTDLLAAKMIGLTRPLGGYKASTVLDFEQDRPLELESLFVEPLRRAQRAKVNAPRLVVLCELLRRLNPH